ncbi:MAG TPA: amidohydrolase [Chloroflexota bacterium]|jgi:amidohydrolase|nr:amidohydrolase [Chloroflexota bacterium]
MAAPTLALQDVAEQVVLDRRHLHANPELGFQERRTAAFITERLCALGLEVQTGIAETGVVGLLRGVRPGKTVLLRADIDALPIQEQNDVPYRSQVDGVMHACGHDGHTAILLNTARVLTNRRDRLTGNVKFVFQPSEEAPPGGAVKMIEEGVLENPRVDAAFGLHLGQNLPLGAIMARPGPISAASDRFQIDITGKGGHAARPHLAVDAALVSAQVLVGLHTLVAREVNPMLPAVVTVGLIQAGAVSNVIPETGRLEGTVRTYDPELREMLARRVQEVATGIAHAMRAECVCHYQFGYPSVVNDPAMTELVAAVAREVIDPEHVILGEQGMGGEDFAYFLQHVPGCFFRVGSRNDERGLIYGHHHPRFDIDEAALPLGIEMFVRVVERYLA